MTGMTGGRLEDRCRRLLRWYPPEHRRVHGEEMVGVLLAAAGPDQEKPGLAVTLDLIKGAALIRLRPGAALSDRDGWRDALAVFSVAAPVLLLAAVCLSYLGDYQWAQFFPGGTSSILDLAVYGQILVVPPVLLRIRRPAVVVAAAQVLLIAAIVGESLGRTLRQGGLIANAAALAAIAGAEIAALLASPGPGRGMALLRSRHWAVLAVAAVPTAVLTPTFVVIRPVPLRFGITGAGVILLVASGAAVLALLLAVWLSSAAGKRLVILFVALGYPCLLTAAVTDSGLTWSAQAGLMASVPMVLVAGAVALAVQRSGRSRPVGANPGPDGHGGGGSQGGGRVA
jgi:hypothetical protein